MSVFNTAYDDVCRYRDRCKCGACGAPLSYPFVCWQGGDAAEAAASEIDARIFDLHERGAIKMMNPDAVAPGFTL